MALDDEDFEPHDSDLDFDDIDDFEFDLDDEDLDFDLDDPDLSDDMFNLFEEDAPEVFKFDEIFSSYDLYEETRDRVNAKLLEDFSARKGHAIISVRKGADDIDATYRPCTN